MAEQADPGVAQQADPGQGTEPHTTTGGAAGLVGASQEEGNSPRSWGLCWEWPAGTQRGSPAGGDDLLQPHACSFSSSPCVGAESQQADPGHVDLVPMESVPC